MSINDNQADELPQQPKPASLTAMSPSDLVWLLSKAAGIELTADMVASDIAAGAPVNEDGTIDVIQYTAWLVLKAT